MNQGSQGTKRGAPRLALGVLGAAARAVLSQHGCTWRVAVSGLSIIGHLRAGTACSGQHEPRLSCCLIAPLLFLPLILQEGQLLCTSGAETTLSPASFPVPAFWLQSGGRVGSLMGEEVVANASSRFWAAQALLHTSTPCSLPRNS